MAVLLDFTFGFLAPREHGREKSNSIQTQVKTGSTLISISLPLFTPFTRSQTERTKTLLGCLASTVRIVPH
jgi:hypothetical protein